MASIQKTVFISYRRTDQWAALAVFRDLTQHGYDVFIDYDGIASGDFEHSIVENIRGRAHFLVLLTPSALARCSEPEDWLRRELEVAVETQRNIVPLLLQGFSFKSSVTTVQQLGGSLNTLHRYQALSVPEDFFDAAMERLRNRFLAVSIEAVVHPSSTHARRVASEQYEFAIRAAALQPVRPSPRPQVRDTRDWERLARVRGTLALVLIAAIVLGISLGMKGVLARFAMATSAVSETSPPSKLSKVAAGSPTDAREQSALGDDYFQGLNGYARSEMEAVKWWRKAAEQGDAHAQAELGLMFVHGSGGLPEDDVAGVRWFRRAAEQGDSLGEFNLGQMYHQGRGGLPQDDVEAMLWFRSAAEQAYAAAESNLGALYVHGSGGLPQDDGEAMRWFRRAAEQGDAAGESSLGVMYVHGSGGLPEDDVEGVKWFRKAAEQGDALGQVNLGLMYQRGSGGLNKDDVEAVKWFVRAAEQGNAPGQASLASMYERGAGGLMRDILRARKLYKLAAMQGNEFAKDGLKRIGEN